jgi:hypothetical protein
MVFTARQWSSGRMTYGCILDCSAAFLLIGYLGMGHMHAAESYMA